MTNEEIPKYLRPGAALDRVVWLINATFDSTRPLWKRLLFGILLFVCVVAVAFGSWWLFAWIFVGLPQGIVTATWNGPCVPGSGIDCTRAIADARQSVLFAGGGLVALLGLYFTYRRWLLEHENTTVAIAEGKRAADRHRREGSQLEITRITDSLNLLESQDDAKRTAAISLLADYAIGATEDRNARLILDVLIAFVKRDDREGRKLVGRVLSDERLPLDPIAGQALLAVLAISSSRAMPVQLAGLTIVDFEADNSDWRYITLSNVAFSRCSLVDARFGDPELEQRKMSLVRFDNSRIAGASFANLDIDNSSFVFSGNLTPQHTLVGASFQESWVARSSFEGAAESDPSMFQDSRLADVSIRDSFTDLEAFIGSWMLRVHFTWSVESHPLCFLILGGEPRAPFGTVTASKVVGVASAKAADLSVPSWPRDSGDTPGDSRSPEPTSTDESPT